MTRGVVIGLIVLGVLFLAMVGAGTWLVPTRPAPDARSRTERDGPPAPVAMLGGLLRPLMKGVKPVPGTARCPGELEFEPAATPYRIARARLAAGAAALVVYRPFDPRSDGETGPYRLCLRADNAGALPLANCDNDKLMAEGSLPVDRQGGCLSVTSLAPGAFRIAWD